MSFKSRIYQYSKKLWPKTIIICYHRIANYKSDPVDITVTQDNFINHVKWLNENYNIINLTEIAECLIARKHLPRNSIAITFDDGYKSYPNTIKYLNQNKIPATFFVCTPIFSNKYFYWDILTHLLIDQREMERGDFDFITNLCNTENIEIEPEIVLDDVTFQETLDWKINSNKFPSNRCKIFELLASNAEYDNGYLQDSLLKRLYSRDYTIDNEKTVFMNDAIMNLGNCHFGAHTLNHYCLSSLGKEQQKHEILDNKKLLGNMVRGKIQFFAYPFGSRKHYNQYSVEIVKNNFILGLSNFPGLIHKESNPYELPRFLIRDWRLDKFEKKINEFFA